VLVQTQPPDHILAEPESAQMLPDGPAGAHGAKPLQCLRRDPGSDNYCLNYSCDDVRTCCKQYMAHQQRRLPAL
jgi:hypothetical protein